MPRSHVTVICLALLASVFMLVTPSCSQDPVTPSVPAPNPVELSITNGHGGVLLYWTSSDCLDFECYELWRADDIGGPEECIATLYEANDVQHYDLSLPPDAVRFYWVRTANSGGESWSNPIWGDWHEQGEQR